MTDDEYCKLGRTAKKYGLDHVDAEIKQRKADGQGDSLRTLAAWVNTQVLQATLVEAEPYVDEEQADYFHKQLRAESRAEQANARATLAQWGIDVEAVEDDFVSYQTVRSHLNECLGLSTRGVKAGGRDPGKTLATLERLQGRMESVLGDLETLIDQDKLDMGKPTNPAVRLSITCGRCGRECNPLNVIDRGECPGCADAQ